MRLFGFDTHTYWSIGISSIVSAALAASMIAVPAQATPHATTQSTPVAANTDDHTDPTAIDSFSARATAVSSGKRVEDTSQATQTSRTFANPDGTWTTHEYGEPIQTQAADGEWSDIDLDLKKNKDGTWSPINAATDIVIGGDNAVEVALDDEGDQRATLTWPTELPEPVIEGSVATFTLSEAQDLVVMVNPTGATYHLRLNEAPADGEEIFEFPIVTQGVELKEKNNILSLVNEDGKRVGQSVPVIAWDASTDRAGDPDNVVQLDATLSTPRVQKRNGDIETVLSLETPTGFLKDPGTEYPVIIDPVIGKVTAGGDSWVRPGTTSSMVGAWYLVVGKTETSHTGDARTYLKWDVSKLAGTTVLKADVNLYQYDAGTCGSSATTNVHPLGAAFNSSTVWTNRPAAALNTGGSTSFTATRGRNGCTTGTTNGWISFNVKNMVQNWASNKVANHGMVLNAPTEYKDNVSYGKRYCSWNEDVTAVTCNTASRSPYLSVTYAKTPPAPTAPTFTSTNVAGWSNAATLALTAKGTDPLGDKVRYLIEVRNSAGSSVVKSCTTGLVASGAAAACNVTGLATGTYKLYAKTTNEPGLSSGYSGATTLNYDITAPANVAVSASGYPVSGSFLSSKPHANEFTFTSSSTDIKHFEYKKDNTSTWETLKLIPGKKSSSVLWNPPGQHIIHAVGVDNLGNRSNPVSFQFGNASETIIADKDYSDLSTMSFEVARLKPPQNSIVFLSPYDDEYAYLYATTNAIVSNGISLSASGTSQQTLNRLNSLGVSRVELVGAANAFDQSFKDELLANGYLLSQKHLSNSTLKWSIASDSQLISTTLVVGDRENTQSVHNASLLALGANQPLLLLDGTEDPAEVNALLSNSSIEKIVSVGKFPEFEHSLSENLAEKIDTIGLEDKSIFQILPTLIDSGRKSSYLTIASANNVGTISAAGLLAYTDSSILLDLQGATDLISVTRDHIEQVSSIGLTGNAIQGQDLLTFQQESLSAPIWRATGVTADATTFTVQHSGLVGASIYKAFDNEGTLVGSGTSNFITIQGASRPIAISAYDNASILIGTLQIRVSEVSEESSESLIASTQQDALKHLHFVGDAGVLRKVSRSSVPITGGLPNPDETLTIAITCEMQLTDQVDDLTKQYFYTVEVLSTNTVGCGKTESEISTKWITGVTFPPTEVPTFAARSQSNIVNSTELLGDSSRATKSIAETAISKVSQESQSNQLIGKTRERSWPSIYFRYQTFIPDEKIGIPGMTESKDRKHQYFSGDNRSYNPDSNSFRFRQEVAVHFGVGTHSNNYTEEMGTTHRWACKKGGVDCVPEGSAKAPLSELSFKDLQSTSTSSRFSIFAEATNPLHALAPSISAQFRFDIRPGGSSVSGTHDKMPLHEMYFDVEGWDEWQYIYRSSKAYKGCLITITPGMFCSQYINIGM